MSFRARLRLFFVLIVIVPMLSVALVLFRLITDNEKGKADAAVAAHLESAVGLYDEKARDAAAVVIEVGNDRVFAQSLVARDIDRARRRAAQLLTSRGIDRITLTRGTRVLVDVGRKDAVASARRTLTGVSGQRFGVLEASATRAAEFARAAR